MIPSLRNLSYEKRLNMLSLKHRVLRGDMIEVFNMIHAINKLSLGKLFCIDKAGKTRKHSLCLKIRRDVNSNKRWRCARRAPEKGNQTWN